MTDVKTMMTNGYDPAPAASGDQYKALEGETGEHFNGYHLMVEAYAAIWLVLMGWLVLVWRSQSRLMTRVDGLEAALARAEQKAGSKTTEAKKKAPETVS